MIRLFRKIRQKLLSDNNYGIYILYASGEIILVVIGILLALQIDNWNDERRELTKETELLGELKENLFEDISQLGQAIKYQEQRILDIGRLVDHLESFLPYEDTLKSYFVTVRHLEAYEINKSGYETLKNTGFELLSSKTLKKEITYYYDIYVNHWSEVVSRLNVEQRSGLNRYRLSKYAEYEGDYDRFYFNMSSQDRFYVNYLKSRISWKKNYINDICSPTIEKAERLITFIEEEIKNLRD